MKLQIISRLNQHQPRKADLSATVKQDRRSSQHSHYSRLFDRHNQPCATMNGRALNKNAKPLVVDIKKFFSVFDQQCMVKYKSMVFEPQGAKRKLESQLASMTMCKDESVQQINLINGFTFSKQNFRLSNVQQESSENHLSKANVREYYCVHQKIKQKLRKFSSLSIIRNEESVHNSERRPGFIMKRNLSVGKKQQDESFLVEHNCKENFHMNGGNDRSMKRVGSKQRFDLVDEQINQSKQRIAKIRKQLNQIYQMRKGPNSNRLKLL